MNKIVIIGGGLSGLAAGEKLAEQGYNVTILEKEEVVGGLARSFEISGRKIPITYHHAQSQDKLLIKYLKDKGMGGKMTWKTIKTAFWWEGQPYLLSNPWHALNFKPLSPHSRLLLLKLGLITLIKKKENWNQLEGTGADVWLEEIVGEEVTTKIFQNLSDIKFGMPLSSISAAWLGRRLQIRSRNLERYGYLKGGLDQLIEKMCSNIVDQGGTILTGVEVNRLNQNSATTTDGEVYEADKIISTIPPEVLKRLSTFSDEIKQMLSTVTYKPVICLVFGASNLITDIYWSIFLKPKMNFGGMFNHTALYPEGGPNGEYVYYLFSYVGVDHPLYTKSPSEIEKIYLKDIKKIAPETEFLWTRCYKLRYSMPIFSVDYKNLPIKLKDGLYLSGVYKEYPNTRTMNTALASGLKTAKYILKEDGLK